MDSISPRTGDIWKEVDPRFTRYIVIHGLHPEAVVIQNAYRAPETIGWTLHGPRRTAQLKRFNGKRGGYEFVQRSSPREPSNP